MIAPVDTSFSETTEVSAAPAPEITYKIAETQEEYEASFRLVYEAYEQSGLVELNKYRLRVTPFHLLPTTNIFIAVADGEVIGTVTLIGDGELGLPMDIIYAHEVDELRASGLSLGEVSCLSHRRQHVRQILPLFVQLTRLMAQHARYCGMDQFLIAIHPRHAQFYVRFMGFDQIGPIKSYPTVRNNPAVACRLDFAKIDHERPACYNQFFGVPISPEKLLPKPISQTGREIFRPAADLGGMRLPGLLC